MKKQFLVFKNGAATSGGDLPKQENELNEGGGGNAQRSGANEQADASRGPVKLASGEDAPEWYEKNKAAGTAQQTEGPNPKKTNDK